ncbi:MAG: hypothetical protein EPN93_16890 [Spirochaetes bacterium]|nr:MAG: hypothetical protein EPN93_16890 [Spirochaetota bacterium]
MRIERGTLGYFITFLILGGVLGSALGTLVVKLAPSLAAVNANLTGALALNLEIVSFGIKVTLASLAGMVLGIVIFLRV